MLASGSLEINLRKCATCVNLILSMRDTETQAFPSYGEGRRPEAEKKHKKKKVEHIWLTRLPSGDE